MHALFLNDLTTKLIRASCLYIGLLTGLPAIAGEPTQARQAELRNLLKHDCGSCHGLTLKGGLGPSLLAKDLLHKPNNYLVNTIQQGSPGTAMPPWQPFMTEDETHWLVEKLLKNP